MAENKKGIIVYADWIGKFEELEDDEAGRLIKHFFRYVNDLNPTAPDRTTKLMFLDIETCLKRDLIKWEKRAERSRENGKNGGRPPKEDNQEKPTETQQVILEPKKPDSDNVNVSVNVIVKDNIEERKLKFANSLKPFLLIYGKDLLNDFYGYWTQHGENDRKFLAEKQKSFGIERRLETWKRNEKTFNKQPLKAERL